MLQESEKLDREVGHDGSGAMAAVIGQSENRKKNQSALRVMDRLGAKLSGMDGVTGGVDMLSVEGQVSWLIREATDFGNLSKLFHGWRAWL